MADTKSIDCTYLHMTNKALLVEVDGEEIWLPLSQLLPDDLAYIAGYQRGDELELEVPLWLLRAKGLDD